MANPPFKIMFTVPADLKKESLRYPKVAAYAITDTVRRGSTEARRLLLAEYPLLKKARLTMTKLFRVKGATELNPVGTITVTSRKISVRPFVVNAAATRRQKGIAVKARVPLQYQGLRGHVHTAPRGFIVGKGKQSFVSNPQPTARGADRFRTMSLVSVSQLVRVPAIIDPLQSFMAQRFTEIFRKKLDAFK